MQYEVYVQEKRNGHTMAHVLELVGCIAQGNTPEEALERLPTAITEYLSWLRAYGEEAPSEGESIEFEVVEHNRSTSTTGLIGFYEPERNPVSEVEIEYFLRLMAHSRDTLLCLVGDLGEAVLRERSPGHTRSVSDILRHIASSEQWYLTRLWHDLPRFPPQRDVFDRLALVREYACRRLGAMSAGERAQVVTARDGELWSARKVFRRFLEHEREHTDEIAERLHPAGRFMR